MWRSKSLAKYLNLDFIYLFIFCIAVAEGLSADCSLKNSQGEIFLWGNCFSPFLQCFFFFSPHKERGTLFIDLNLILPPCFSSWGGGSHRNKNFPSLLFVSVVARVSSDLWKSNAGKTEREGRSSNLLCKYLQNYKSKLTPLRKKSLMKQAASNGSLKGSLSAGKLYSWQICSLFLLHRLL